MPNESDLIMAKFEAIEAMMKKQITDLKSDLSEQINGSATQTRSDFSAEFEKFRVDQKSVNEALNDLTAWRDETTKKLDGAVSSINDLNNASLDFSRETTKIRQVEARLDRVEKENKNFRIQADIDRCDKEIIMPKLNTNNRGEVFTAIQRNLSRVADSLGFSPSLIGIKPMGPAIGCLTFPSSMMRERALNAFRQASPPIPVFVPTPGTKEFRDSLSPTKSFLYECKRSKLVETYKFAFLPVDGEIGAQVGIRKAGKAYQFLTLKSSALMSPNAAQEVYYKLVSNWFSNETLPDLQKAYDAQMAKLAIPPRPAPAPAPAPGGSTQVAPESAPDSVPAPAPIVAPIPASQPTSTCWSKDSETDSAPPPQAETPMEEGEGREEGELDDLEYPPLGETKKRARGSNSTPTKKQVEKKIRQGKSKSSSGSGSD